MARESKPEKKYSMIAVPVASYGRLKAHAADKGMLIRKCLELAIEMYLKAQGVPNDQA